MKNVLSDKFIEETSAELLALINQVNADILGIFAKRIKETGELSATDVHRLTQMARIDDLKKIEAELLQMSKEIPPAVAHSFEEVAKRNQELTKQFYDYRGIEQIGFAEHSRLKDIVSVATKLEANKLLNLCGTAAFNIDGTITDIRLTYTNLINKAIFAVEQGYTDYYTALRSTVKQLAGSGIQAVDYASGRSINLASAVRMNILDGARQMSIGMREQEATEYGADGWEISAHGLCRPSHQPYQGRVFSFEEFDKINATVLASNPIATGMYNCHHTRFGVIMEINKPAYTKQELYQMKEYSNSKVTFQMKTGEMKTLSLYEASQIQRQQENIIRKLKDQKKMLKNCGDTLGAKQTSQSIKDQSKWYAELSEAIGLTQKKNRLTSLR